jgi:hypothetical protein
VKVIKVTKFEGRVIFAFGVLVLVLCSILFVRWTSVPDIHRELMVSVQAENLTRVTIRNVEGTHTLSGSFVVREGTIDFIIASAIMTSLVALFTLGANIVGHGGYRQENVTEDRFEIVLNRPGDLLDADDIWYLVFDNRNSTEPKTIDLSYKLHPHDQDIFLFATIGLFVAGISVIFLAVVIPRTDLKNDNKQAYKTDDHDPKS